MRQDLALSSFLIRKLALDFPSDLFQTTIDNPTEVKTVKDDVVL